MEKDRYMMSSLANGLKVLDTLSKYQEQGVTELSKELGLGKSSVFRMLYTLEKCGYVEKDKDSKYTLSLKFARFGTLVKGRQYLLRTCIPHMAALRDKYNETVNLAVLTRVGKVMFIHRESSSYAMQMNIPFANESEAYCMASGKVMLACLEEAALNDYIKTIRFCVFTPSTITSVPTLRTRLAQIRAQGYGEDAEESEIGLTCYAAPIFDYDDKCVAAISVSGATSRMLENRENLVADVQKTARAISLALGNADENG
jgi:DNA-binding IclR family transcriptional regulator